jgi:hypothetical protein
LRHRDVAQRGTETRGVLAAVGEVHRYAAAGAHASY